MPKSCPHCSTSATTELEQKTGIEVPKDLEGAEDALKGLFGKKKN